MTIRIPEGVSAPANDETMLGGTSGTTSTVDGAPVALAQTGAADEIPVSPLTQDEWYALTVKSTTARVTQYFFKRNAEGVNADLYVWPTPSDTTYDMKLWLQYPLRDVTVGTDDVYFTQEWYLPLSFELASLLGTKHGIHPQELSRLHSLAEEYRWYASTYDTDGSVYFQPRRQHG
jgi:hypothetical protein